MLNKGLNEINQLNKEFYEKHNESFDKSRSYGFWTGFEEILKFIPENLKILDLGCGNGRFLKFLLEKNYNINSYLGIDNSKEFIGKNSENYPNHSFKVLDVISEVEKLSANYSLITAFGITHHLPSQDFRNQWFKYIGSLTSKGGFLILSFWNFDTNKATNIPDLKNYLLEKGDYFLGWKEDYSILRYCHYFDEAEINLIIENLNDFSLIKKFDQDQNTYLILQKNS